MPHFIRSMRNDEFCEDFAKDYKIFLNASKSKLMYFGKDNLSCESYYVCLMVAV